MKINTPYLIELKKEDNTTSQGLIMIHSISETIVFCVCDFLSDLYTTNSVYQMNTSDFFNFTDIICEVTEYNYKDVLEISKHNVGYTSIKKDNYPCILLYYNHPMTKKVESTSFQDIRRNLVKINETKHNEIYNYSKDYRRLWGLVKQGDVLFIKLNFDGKLLYDTIALYHNKYISTQSTSISFSLISDRTFEEFRKMCEEYDVEFVI